MCLGDGRLPPRDRDSTLRAPRNALNDKFDGARNPEKELCNSLWSSTPTLWDQDRWLATRFLDRGLTAVIYSGRGREYPFAAALTPRGEMPELV